MSWKFTETKNKHLLSKAFDWYLTMPGFIKQSCGYDENDREIFIENLLQGRTFVGHLNGQARAIVLAEQRGIIEGHVYADKGTPSNFLTALISYSHSRLNAPVLVEISSRQKPLQEIVKRAGFQDTGLHKWKGVYRGKPLETTFFLAN